MSNMVYATHLIPASRIEAMAKAVDKLARKVESGKTAAEFPPAIEATREVIGVWDNNTFSVFNADVTYSKMAEFVPYVWVTLKYARPILNGWQLLAVYDWEVTEDGTRTCYVSSVPGAYLLPDQHECEDGRCDHCNTKRIRNKSMLITKNYMDFKVVGSTCIKDFLGHATPNSFIDCYNFEMEVERLTDSSYAGGASVAMIPVKVVLQLSAAFVAEYGYVKANEFNATADLVRQQIFPSVHTKLITPCDMDINTAKMTAEWIMAQDSASDYISNIQKAITAGAISHKRIGVVVSAVYAYQKHLERIAADAGPICNEYLGEVKSRLKGLTATVTRVRHTEGFYGITTIVTLKTPMGHTLTWFASGSIDVNANDVWKFDGTVKDHKEYNGTRQTVLSRVKYQAS